ncbi:MAG: SufD family Fe-S cluster assembly protein [Candidatus Methanomethylicia archaeon]
MSKGKGERLEAIKAKAIKSIDKPPSIGPDLDLSKFNFTSTPLSNITKDLEVKAPMIGVNLTGGGRSGNYLQVDSSILWESSSSGDVEVMSISKALEAYDWLLDYYWRALDVDMDRFTALSELKSSGGFFIRVKSGVKIELPVQTCLYLKTKGYSQNVHNIIIVEENAELNVITGCASPMIDEGLHIGVSEFYIKSGGKLNYIMAHSWSEGVDVRPRTGVMVEDDASFNYIYININPVNTLQSMPIVHLNGKNSKANLFSVVSASSNGYFDIGGAVYLEGENSRAEIVSKSIAKDEARVVSRGLIVGEGLGVKGHLECRGIILSPKAVIQAIPQLDAKVMDASLSHEAAIGKISEDEIYYLMARGFSGEEAVSLIVRGFMSVDTSYIPSILSRYVKWIVDNVARKL